MGTDVPKRRAAEEKMRSASRVTLALTAGIVSLLANPQMLLAEVLKVSFAPFGIGIIREVLQATKQDRGLQNRPIAAKPAFLGNVRR
jgi:hypothetical protein